MFLSPVGQELEKDKFPKQTLEGQKWECSEALGFLGMHWSLGATLSSIFQKL